MIRTIGGDASRREIAPIWQMREAALPSLYGLRGGASRSPSSRTSACRSRRCPSICAACRRSCKSTRRRRRFLDPRRRRPGPHAAVPRPAQARRTSARLWAMAEKVHDARPRARRHRQHPARHRPGADAVGRPAVRAALSRFSASSRRSSIRGTSSTPARSSGPIRTLATAVAAPVDGRRPQIDAAVARTGSPAG